MTALSAAEGSDFAHRCACPRRDAADCAAVRYGRDLRLFLDGDDYHDDPDFDPCGCMCHDQEETDDDD